MPLVMPQGKPGKSLPGIGHEHLLGTEVTNLQDVIPRECLSRILETFNVTLTQTVYVGSAMASLSFHGGVGIEWKSVKDQNFQAAAVQSLATLLYESTKRVSRLAKCLLCANI